MQKQTKTPSTIQKGLTAVQPVTDPSKIVWPDADDLTGNLLASRACLVQVSISAYNGSITDRRTTAEVYRVKGINAGDYSRDAGHWTKRLFPELLKKVRKPFNALRTRHYELTVPYSYDGWCLCPASILMDYMAELDAMEAECWKAVEEGIALIDEYREKDRIRLNGTFSALDYPDAEAFRGEWKIERSIAPVPAFGDWLPDAMREEADRVMRGHEARMRLELVAATNAVYKRLADLVGLAIKNLHEFGQPAGKKRSRTFRDSMITNLRDLTLLLPALNIAGDATLAAIGEDVARRLCAYDPNALREYSREGSDLRAEALKAACEIGEALIDSGRIAPIKVSDIVTATGNNPDDLAAALGL